MRKLLGRSHRRARTRVSLCRRTISLVTEGPLHQSSSHSLTVECFKISFKISFLTRRQPKSKIRSFPLRVCVLPVVGNANFPPRRAIRDRNKSCPRKLFLPGCVSVWACHQKSL